MKEIRKIDNITSINSESRIIEGYCVVFNKRSQLLQDKNGNYFYEYINPTAITKETIDNSDIYFLLDHNVSRGILARSNHGKGSLKLELDSNGLKFSFEAPNTALGNEVLEGIRRNDINGCSFAFTVEDDSFSYDNDGYIIRNINLIDRLYDCSVVYNPAYLQTRIDLRGLDAFLSNSNEENNDSNINYQMNDEKRLEEELRASNDEEKETDKEEKNQEEEKEEKSEEQENTDEDKKEDSEEKSDEPDEDKEEEKEEKDCKDPDDEKRNINNNSNKELRNNPNHNIMNKKFSLINTINDVVNNRNFNEASAEVISRSKDNAIKNGINFGSAQIVLSGLNDEEKRAVANPNGILAQEATYGEEAVPSEIFDITGALRDKMVLTQAGARFVNVTSNLDFVTYEGSVCGWGDEIEEAADGSGKFNLKKLSPRRLCTVLPISKTWLAQADGSAEQLLREDLVNAVAETLQRTILGDEAGSDVKPEGLMYQVNPDLTTFEYADAVNIEQYLEAKNFNTDNAKWVVSPSAKALMRNTKVDAGSGRFVYENNEVLGVPAYSTSSMVDNGAIYGDWSELIIANWNSMSILVDPYTLAAKNQIRLVVNYYVNYILRREDALVKHVIKG